MNTCPDKVHQAHENEAQVERLLLRRQVEFLAKELAAARRSPMSLYKEKLQAAFARLLAMAPWSMPYRRRMRFARSAEKRLSGRSLSFSGTEGWEQGGQGSPSPAEYRRWIREIEAEQDIPTVTQSVSICILVQMERASEAPELARTLASLVVQKVRGWHCIVLVPNETATEMVAPTDPAISLRPEVSPDEVKADHVLLLRAGDQLALGALAHLAHAISGVGQGGARPDVLYGDTDQMDADGTRSNPAFRSAWNPDLLYSTPYLGRVLCLSRERFGRLFSVAHERPARIDHDVLLDLCAELPEEAIRHVPAVLCHLGSNTEKDPEPDPDAVAHFLGLPVLSQSSGHPRSSSCRPIWPLPAPVPSVCLIIPTRDRRTLTETAVKSILELTKYENYEILIVDNGSTEPEMLLWLEEITAQEARVRVLRYPHAFNYSAINNFAVAHTDAEVIGLINNDVEAIHSDWLREMVSHAMRPDIGCVGAKLIFENTRIQHAGVALGIGPVAGHIFANLPVGASGYLNHLNTIRNVSAVTGACIVMRRALYEAVGGLDAENLAVTCNDVDLCLKVGAAGHRSLWTPHAVLFHHESVSRGQDVAPEKRARLAREQAHMQKTWGLRPGCDPFVNPHQFLWL